MSVRYTKILSPVKNELTAETTNAIVKGDATYKPQYFTDVDFKGVSETARKNRKYKRYIMEKNAAKNAAKEKKSKIVSIILIVAAVLVQFLLFKGFVIDIFNGIFPPQAPESLNLTQEQKLEDFEYVYDTLTESLPMIDCYEELYDISFRNNKEKYEQLIRETESDIEFYTALSAIIQDVPSFHTDLLSPDDISGLHCYNANKVSSDRAVIANNKYFRNEIDEKISEYPDIKYAVFTYVDGAYYFDPTNCNDESYQQYSKIKAINDEAVDEYVLNVPSSFELAYDGVYDKSMRTRIVLNDMLGDEVKVTIELADGTEETKLTYISTLADWMWMYSDIYQKKADQSYTYYDDDENQISYIQINSMGEADGDEIKDVISKLKYEDIILDIRNNYGGNTSYASDYIYPELFADSVTESGCWYMPATGENKTIIKNPFNYILLKPKKNADAPYDADVMYYSSKVKYKYKGKAANNKNVTLLVGKGTGSAADRFVSDMKKNGLVTVVGNNTGGEGLANSYNMVSLPNSKFVLIYMPGGAKNPDGTDNSVYRTAPDYYVTQTIDDYYAMQQSLSDEKFDYQKNYEYDTVLRYAIEKKNGFK